MARILLKSNQTRYPSFERLNMNAKVAFSVLGLAVLAGIGFSTPASAVPCNPCDGVTFSTTDPGDATGGGAVEIDNAALTFLATFSPHDQGNSTGKDIPTAVPDYLAGLGFTGTVYLGRANGGGGGQGGGSSVSTTGTQSGTWTFTPGTTGDVAEFIVLHAGSGQFNVLYEINPPLTNSGIWDTSENIVGNNGSQGGLSNFDLFGGPAGSVPEPSTIAVLGVGLLGLGLLRWRKAS
jgi:hypothetical protein